MGYGNCVVVNDTPENREVAGDAALYFRAGAPGDPRRGARAAARATPARSRRRGAAAAARAAERYNWETIADQYAPRCCARGGRARRAGERPDLTRGSAWTFRFRHRMLKQQARLIAASSSCSTSP